MKPQPRIYLLERIFLSVTVVVMLHRPPQDIITFFPGEAFFSKRRILYSEDSLGVFSRMLAAVMSPAAPAPMMAMVFMREVYDLERKIQAIKKT